MLLLLLFFWYDNYGIAGQKYGQRQCNENIFLECWYFINEMYGQGNETAITNKKPYHKINRVLRREWDSDRTRYTESQLNHSTHADLCSQIFCFMCISYGFISYGQWICGQRVYPLSHFFFLVCVCLCVCCRHLSPLTAIETIFVVWKRSTILAYENNTPLKGMVA